MLAYLFWHRPSADAESCERRLAEFHARLRADPPAQGAGGVYRLRDGQLALQDVGDAIWSAEPPPAASPGPA